MFALLALSPFLLSKFAYGADSPQKTLCDVTDVVIDIPPGQKNISIPSNTKPIFIGLGLGTQNYTCSPSGTYAYLCRSAGAIAELLDISCYAQDAAFAQLRKRSAPFPDSDAVWEHEARVRALLGPLSLRLGQHYFVPSPAGGIAPKFDFTADLFKNDSTQFITNTKIGNLAAPNKTRDVDLLELGHQDGNLADFVFRLNTHFGQPPSTCQPGSAPIQVRYSANYYFLKNTTSSSTSSTGSSAGKNSALNAATLSDLSSDTTDPDRLQKLLDYAPVILGLLAVTTLLSLILVVIGVMALCRRRGGSAPTRSAAYHPIQLPRTKTPEEGSYHDDPVPYGA